jgi:hypothetical protein
MLKTIIPDVGQWVEVDVGGATKSAKVIAIDYDRSACTGILLPVCTLLETKSEQKEFSFHQIEEVIADHLDILALEANLQGAGKEDEPFQKTILGVTYDCCVLCGEVTSYRSDVPVRQRIGYQDGMGQLCPGCAIMI